MTRIRLARKGRKGVPFFHILVMDQKTKRDGKFIELIGTYNPLLKTNNTGEKVTCNIDRFNYWLKVGAQPSDKVSSLIKKFEKLCLSK